MITRLKLVNFIGIKSGTGKNEIEIVFPKNGNVITALQGENGSGKSTILSMLTPFKDSFDENRKSLIIPGTEGVKEIDFFHKGHEYKIKHIYGKTTSSFISKDGVELNANGGVRTCEDHIEEELGVNKDYYKISKLGNTTNTFINFTTTQRKAYIFTFIESVKKYIDAYKIVAEKSKDNDNKIKQITSELKKLDDIDTIKKKIEENKIKLEETNTDIDNKTSEIGSLNAEINIINDVLKKIDYLNQKALLSVKQTDINKYKTVNKTFEEKYGKVSLEDCNNKIQELTSVINDLNNKKTEQDGLLSVNTANIASNLNEITKANSQLVGKSIIDLNKLLTDINKDKDEKANLEKQLNSKLANLIKNDRNNMPVYIDTFKTFITNMTSYYATLNDTTLFGRRNVEIFFSNECSKHIRSLEENNKAELSNNKTKLESYTEDFNKKSVNLDKLEILDKRPDDCTIDTCPFISDALKYKNLPEEINDISKTIDEYKTKVKTNEDIDDKIADLKTVYSTIAKLYISLNAKNNIVFRYFVSLYGNVSTFMTNSVNDITEECERTVSIIENITTKLDSLDEYTNSIAIKEEQYNKSIEQENNRLYFENELVELNKKKNELNAEKIQLTSEINNLKSQITNESATLKEYTDYRDSLTKTNAIEDEAKKIEEVLNVYETNSKEKNIKITKKTELENKLEEDKISRNTLNNEITTMKANEISINKLTQSYNDLQLIFNDIEIVKKALSPKSGIPLIFVKSYLGSTEAMANDLLNIAYNGQFEIRFVPTETDFFIQVRHKENVIEDIKAASAGEQAMTAISISLALIERSMGDFNIMYLDEIDGPLDASNRQSFINILNKQISKLGIEQIFIISHNNALDSCPMNLILLHNHNIDKTNQVFMKNKNIIYEVE